jgi:hypothetical protein
VKSSYPAAPQRPRASSCFTLFLASQNAGQGDEQGGKVGNYLDAGPRIAAPHRSVSLNWLEEVVGNVPTDRSSDVRSFLVGVAEVEAS